MSHPPPAASRRPLPAASASSLHTETTHTETTHTMFPATNKRPGTHQRKRGVILSVAFRKTPESKERKGEGKGEKRAKVPTGSNEPQKYFDRCGHLVPCRSGWLLRPLRSRKGMSQLGIPKMRQTSHFLRHKPSTVRCGHLRSQSRGTWTYARSTGPREALCGLIPGWHEARHT